MEYACMACASKSFIQVLGARATKDRLRLKKNHSTGFFGSTDNVILGAKSSGSSEWAFTFGRIEN